MTISLWLSLCICCLVGAAKADGVEKNEHDLRRSLMEGYDKFVRPVRSAATSVPVHINIFPVGIKDVDVKDKIIKLDTWLFATWEDEFLRWDPADFSGIHNLRLPASEVWRPDLTVYYATPDTNVVPEVLTNVVIYPNGTVLWVPPYTIKSRCQPTDVQDSDDTFKCTITVGSWTYDVTLLDLQEQTNSHRRDHFYDTHKDWTIESMTAHREATIYACCAEEYPSVKFEFLFKKKPEHDHH